MNARYIRILTHPLHLVSLLHLQQKPTLPSPPLPSPSPFSYLKGECGSPLLVGVSCAGKRDHLTQLLAEDLQHLVMLLRKHKARDISLATVMKVGALYDHLCQ